MFADILVSTPDRLLALIKENGIEMKRVQHLVLDEADKLFELGLIEKVDEIIAECQKSEVADKLQRSLFSATLPPSVEELARTILRNPLRVLVGAKCASDSHTHTHTTGPHHTTTVQHTHATTHTQT